MGGPLEPESRLKGVRRHASQPEEAAADDRAAVGQGVGAALPPVSAPQGDTDEQKKPKRQADPCADKPEQRQNDPPLGTQSGTQFRPMYN